jgi:hypothetical protein
VAPRVGEERVVARARTGAGNALLDRWRSRSSATSRSARALGFNQGVVTMRRSSSVQRRY